MMTAGKFGRKLPLWDGFPHGGEGEHLPRLRNKSFLWRSASLRACLRQQGIVIFQRLTARVNSCPDTRLHTRGLFPQTLQPCRKNSTRTWASEATNPASKIVYAIISSMLLLFSLSTWAQQPDVPPEGTTAGNYNIRQSAELGYRITGQRGNRSVFDSIVDDHTELRLLDQSLEVRSLNNAGLLFDSFSLSSFGLGGEPSSVIRLRAAKNKLYNFNASFRRDHNYWDYNLLANPLNPPTSLPFVPILNSPHRFDVVRRMSDYNATLFPQSLLRIGLADSRNPRHG